MKIYSNAMHLRFLMQGWPQKPGVEATDSRLYGLQSEATLDDHQKIVVDTIKSTNV